MDDNELRREKEIREMDEFTKKINSKPLYKELEK